MDRRFSGAMLLGIAMIAAIVLPNLQSNIVRGMAAIAPIPVPPHVGQCLLQSPPDPDLVTGGQAFRLGRCTAAHYGEVAEVVLDSTAAPSADQFTARIKPCSDESAYLGWVPPVKPTTQVQWRSIDVTVIGMAPTPVQRSFGQKWVACVVTPSTYGASYNGSVRDVFKSGRLPASFAECLTTGETLGPPTRCDQPHRYEVFGFADVSTAFRDQALLNADCRTIVKSSTRMSDTTAGGALTIRAAPFHFDAFGNPKPGLANNPPDEAAEAVCTVGVTGSNLLTGTLFGIGTDPLPWA